MPTEFGNVLLNADISPKFTKNMKGFLLLILSQMKRRMSLFSATTCCNVRNPCHMSNLRNSTGWEGVPGGRGTGWEGGGRMNTVPETAAVAQLCTAGK